MPRSEVSCRKRGILKMREREKKRIKDNPSEVKEIVSGKQKGRTLRV